MFRLPVVHFYSLDDLLIDLPLPATVYVSDGIMNGRVAHGVKVSESVYLFVRAIVPGERICSLTVLVGEINIVSADRGKQQRKDYGLKVVELEEFVCQRVERYSALVDVVSGIVDVGSVSDLVVGSLDRLFLEEEE